MEKINNIQLEAIKLIQEAENKLDLIKDDVKEYNEVLKVIKAMRKIGMDLFFMELNKK